MKSNIYTAVIKDLNLSEMHAFHHCLKLRELDFSDEVQAQFACRWMS